MPDFERIVRAQARQFFWPGADREDVEQEARLALVRHRPESKALAKIVVQQHLTDCLRTATRTKRPVLVQQVEIEARSSLEEQVIAREQLRAILSADLTPRERSALRRIVAGLPKASRSEDNARQRVRAKLRAAA